MQRSVQVKIIGFKTSRTIMAVLMFDLVYFSNLTHDITANFLMMAAFGILFVVYDGLTRAQYNLENREGI